MDLTSLGSAALARHDAWAPLLVFGAGIASSVGPCVAPRFIAVSAAAGSSGQPARIVGAFVAGLVLAYAAIGAALVAIADVVAVASWIYAAVALALVAGGLWTVARAHAHDDRCTHAKRTAPPGRATLLRAALLGASFAFVVSPCCTPLVLAVVAATTQWGGPANGAWLLAWFGLGHSLPLVVSGAIGARVAGWAARRRLDQAVAIASGTMMFALGCYYAALA